MAKDMFLKLEGIDGESVVKGFEKQIDILAWSWGLSQTGSFSTGGGGGAGKVTAQDISFTKMVDASTPHISQKCCSGEHITKATLVCRKAGGTQMEYVKLTLEKCLVSSVSCGGSEGSDGITENFSLNFATFKLEYWPQKDDGTQGSVVPAGWDLKANVKL